MLLGVTVVWGTTFPAMKQLSAQFAAMEIILLRFVLSSAVLLPWVSGLRRSEVRWGVAIGAVQFVAFYLQVTGLAHTSSNRNAFVTGLNVLFVPAMALFLGQRLRWTLVLGAVLGVLGLGGMFYEQAPWSYGDSLTLAGAFVYAVFVLMFEYSARAAVPVRAERLAVVQSATMLVLAALGFGFTEPASLSNLWQRSQNFAWLLVYLGVIASAVMVWLQAWGQHRVRAVEAALVYGLEPAFAALAAVWWIGETMTARALIGGVLIVLGVVVAQTGALRKSGVALEGAYTR